MDQNVSTELTPPGGWAHANPVRLPPPPRGQRGWLFRQVSRLSRFAGRDDVPDVFSVFQINSRLFWPWLWFASRLMPGGRLKARTRELVILRTAWACRSRYEWGQHVELALKAGATDAEIVAVTEGPGAFEEDAVRAALMVCDDICQTHTVSDESWALARAHYSDPLMIELVILTGHYVMLAGLLNTSGIALDADMDAELAVFTTRMRS